MRARLQFAHTNDWIQVELPIDFARRLLARLERAESAAFIRRRDHEARRQPTSFGDRVGWSPENRPGRADYGDTPIGSEDAR